MHVVYIHQYFTKPTEPGGTRSYEMARRLLNAEHRVSMVCGTFNPSEMVADPTEIRREQVDGIDVYRIMEPYRSAMSFPRRWLSFLRFGKKATRLIRRFSDVDLVFATSTPLPVGRPGMLSARFHRVPFVFEVRDLWPELPIAMGLVKNSLLKWYLRAMERRFYRAASRIIALAPGIRDGVCRTGYPEDRVAMIPNSSDVELFHPAEGNTEVDADPRFGRPGDFRLAFTGAHGLANGLRAVLDAVEVLKQRGVGGVQFCFIGGGPEKAGLVSRARDRGLDAYCRWIDPLPKTELARLLPQMDVGMMILKNVPAFYRGTSPNKFFDYLACGLPVLNNYPGWVAQIITESQCGVVVEPDNPAAFADAVSDLMAHREALPVMGQRARQAAESQFSRDELGRRFVEVLESSVGG